MGASYFQLLLLVGVTYTLAHRLNFYRKDYTYFEEFDAFYKVHWDINGVSYNTAFLSCDDEGAQLFYPEKNNEWKIVKNLSELLPEYPNVSSIFVGIHDEMGLGEFITVDGRSTPSPLQIEGLKNDTNKECIIMNIETGEYGVDDCNADDIQTVRAYVCKRRRDVSCPTIDTGYKYVKEFNRCYKVNDRMKTWNEALRTCFMEGGILAVIENEPQANIIKNMILPDIVHFVGFRNSFDDELYTVRGKKLHNNGYEQWDNSNNDSHERCGVVITNYQQNLLYTRTMDCISRHQFICQMELHE